MKTTLLQTTCSISHLPSLPYHARYFSLFSNGQQGLKCSFSQKSEQRQLKFAVIHERISAGQNYQENGIRKLPTRREGLLSLSLSLPLSLSISMLAASVSISLPQLAKGEEIKLNFERYNDETEGFTLLIPSDWKKVDKAGATVLFEDPDVKSNNIGVVVNPIRISSLKEFGTPEVVADKLLQAEKKKVPSIPFNINTDLLNVILVNLEIIASALLEKCLTFFLGFVAYIFSLIILRHSFRLPYAKQPSTNDARLIKADQRPIHGDIPLYELEYTLDSSRGIKRVLSAVTVASKKLYLLNIAYSDSPEKPLLPNTRMLLEQVLNSFDVLS